MRLIWRWRGVLEGEWAEASGWLCCTWGHLSRSDSISHLAPPHDALRRHLGQEVPSTGLPSKFQSLIAVRYAACQSSRSPIAPIIK